MRGWPSFIEGTARESEGNSSFNKDQVLVALTVGVENLTSRLFGF